MSLENEEKVRGIVRETLAEINLQLPAERRLETGDEVPLFGEEGGLDSLGLVNLIVGIEGRMSGEFGVAVNLADERLMGEENSPFRTVGSLISYVASLL